MLRMMINPPETLSMVDTDGILLVDALSCVHCLSSLSHGQAGQKRVVFDELLPHMFRRVSVSRRFPELSMRGGS